MDVVSDELQLPRLFASDITKFSDAELDRYLGANRRLVQVHDPQNLTEEFIQRLRARADVDNTTQSRPIDLDDVAQRLQQGPQGYEASQRASSIATTEDLGEEEYHRRDLEVETADYDELIRSGGQPSHPVRLGREILDHPGEFREVLSYWQLVNHDTEGRVWMVFGSQLREWHRFLEYQRRGRSRFPTYITALDLRFKEHGFARPYRLDVNPKQQDRLTTWIEFLGYEYSIHDRYVATLKRRQPSYDEAWKKLVDSQLLRPHETEEFICSRESAYERGDERKQAEQELRAVERKVVLAEQTVNDRCTQPTAMQPRSILRQAYRLRDSATDALAIIRKRNDAVYSFFCKTAQANYANGRLIKGYQEIKKDAESRRILLRWILQQISIIELGLKCVKKAGNEYKESSGQRTSKRSRVDEDLNEERFSKRLRQLDGTSSTSNIANPIAGTKEHDGRPNGAEHVETRLALQRRQNDYDFWNVSFYPRRSPRVATTSTPVDEPASRVLPSPRTSGRLGSRGREVSSPTIRPLRKRKSGAIASAKKIQDGKPQSTESSSETLDSTEEHADD